MSLKIEGNSLLNPPGLPIKIEESERITQLLDHWRLQLPEIFIKICIPRVSDQLSCLP